MEEADKGQVIKSAAQVYEEFFVPALFQEWTERIIDRSGISKGQAVLDVACGTGVLTRAVFEKTGPTGSVCGLDLNDGMLAVARLQAPNIEWRHAAAESMPFEDETFDTVVCQFGLMFFEDKAGAIREMYRVLNRGGKLVVAVWDSLENVPGYQRVVELLKRLFGDDVADTLRSPYSLGDEGKLRKLFNLAGISDATVENLSGKARFPSIESWMFTDVRGWTLADIIDDKQFEILLTEAEKELERFLIADGSVEFDHPAFIVSAVKS